MRNQRNNAFFLLYSFKYKCSIFRRLESEDLFYFRDHSQRGKWQRLKTDKRGKYLIFKSEKFYLIFDIWQQQEPQQEKQRADERHKKRVYLRPPKLQLV